MTNIILCGGSGTRLWPISRTLLPKQFVKLFDDKSLFQLTIQRNLKVCTSQLIVSNIDQYFLAFDQLQELHQTNVTYILEPIARNTAPAIALACMALHYDEIVLVTPSDHFIKNEQEYQKVVDTAKKLAFDDYLVTFGIKPTFAETGFGYIEAHGETVKAFHEKPSLHTAQKYFEAGNYYWNSGMFCFKAGVFLEELQKYSPHIYEASKLAFENTKIQNRALKIEHSHMSAIPEDSIDYAVMEKSTKVKVVPSDISWSDVGSFDALYEELPKNEQNNASLLINEQNTNSPITIDSKNNLIISEKQVALVDVDDLIVVDTGDALLISKKGSSQKVKEAVKRVSQTTQLHNIHLTVHRPWGTYTVLQDSQKYKIKRIEVKPSGRLSLQKHFHRSEHWTVVSGTAIVTLGEKEFALRANESIYIPMGELHRLHNAGKLPLIIIETQIGDYLGEDDIVRVCDDYSRGE